MDRKHYLKCFSEQLGKLSEIKEKDLIPKMVKKFAESATVDGYEKIITIITKSIPKGLYTVKDLNSAKIQADIFRLLSTTQKVLTVSEILKSKYFSGSVLTSKTIDVELGKMISHGAIEEFIIDGNLLYGVKGSREKLKSQRMINSYNEMINQMNIAIKTKNIESLRFVAGCFESLGNYNDSVQKCEECRLLARKLETEKIAEKERQNEIIRQKNLSIQNKTAQLKQQLAMQEKIYNENRNKIFGSGAKLRASAKIEIERLQREINELQSKMV